MRIQQLKSAENFEPVEPDAPAGKIASPPLQPDIEELQKPIEKTPVEKKPIEQKLVEQMPPKKDELPVSTSEQVDEQNKSTNWQDQVPVDNRSVASRGLLFVFGFLGLFLLWAVLFPISSAVVSMGKIVSAGSNKLIQHPTGGVVKQILVEDGEQVEKNQILVVLNPSASQAELGRLTARRRRLQVMQTRLQSEQSGNGFGGLSSVSTMSLRGTEGNIRIKDNSVERDKIIAEQRREYNAGRSRLNAQVDAATSQMESLRDQRSGLQARLAGEERQLNYTKMELGKVRPLVNQGYLAKNRLWELDRRRLEQLTAVGNLEAEIDSVTQRIEEADANIEQLTEADKEQRAEELTNVMSELDEIRDQIKAAETSVTLTELRAPVAGTVTNMTANTTGGVVAPGDVVAQVVPNNSGLITEFRVAPQDIKSIKIGQKARVTVTAFNQRTYQPIEGEVTYVSADSQTDEQTGEVYFLGRAKLTGNQEKNDGVGEVKPGMQTQVFALAEPRVFLDYLLQPIRDSLNKAFRETN